MEPNQTPPTQNQANQQGFYTPSMPPQQTVPGFQDDEFDDGSDDLRQDVAPQSQPISWEASEYIASNRGPAWIAGLVVIALIGAGLAVWLQAWTFAILVVAMAVALGFYGVRQPRQLSYSLDDHGLTVGKKFYPYSHFRAFGVVPEEDMYSIMLIPIRRFSPAITIYFNPDNGEEIVDILGSYLPMQHMEPDLMDQVFKRLRL